MVHWSQRLACVSLFVFVTAAAADPLDWTHWRGPQQNGISAETGLVDRFDPQGGPDSNLLWKNEEAAGISTPIVMDGRLFTIVRDQPDTPREGEKVICLDAATGRKLWENRFNVFLSGVPAERVGWSNCAGDPETGRIYALGVCDLFQCLDAKSGRTIWARSLSEEFGMLNTYGGRTNTPVVFEHLVIISGVTTAWGETARPAHRLLAFDKLDGRLVWITSTRQFPEDTTYSTPFVTAFNGQPAIVFGAGDGSVYAVQPRTGKVIWNSDLSRRGVNVSPIVVGHTVFASHSEENMTGTTMGAVVAIDGRGTGDITKTAEIWRVDRVMVGKSSPLFVPESGLQNDGQASDAAKHGLRGRLYTVDDSAGLRVLDAATGDQIGRTVKLGTSMRGSLVWADGKIYANTAGGICYVLRPTETGVKIAFRTRLPSGEECAGSPVVSHGRIYLPSTGGLYCLATAGAAQPVSSAGEKPRAGSSTAETPERDSKPAHLQLIPAEALVRPGESIRFEVCSYNARGQKLDALPAIAFSVTGSGAITADGVFHAASGATHSAAFVTVRSGKLSSQSRIRIVPPLPWTFDFSDKQLPVTWIGAAYRHEPRDVNDESLIAKITTIPKGTVSQAWMGQVDLHGYTVQADLLAATGKAAAKLPDMGLIAQRYTIDLRGEAQELQIRTWPPQLRMAKTMPFSWRANTWYRVRLHADVENGQAVLRGKVWPRGEPEPSGWTITATDETPNLSGSPGLFGNSTNAEILIDNVTVVPNEP